MSKQIQFTYEVLEESALPLAVVKLKEEAEAAMKKAYAPYSKFSVGAALLLDNGVIVSGSNQENAAYPSGLCAERTALFYAHAQYPEAEIQQLFITTSFKKENAAISPCGSCRQVLLEYENLQKEAFEIWFPYGENAYIKVNSVKHLLPFSFSNEMLP